MRRTGRFRLIGRWPTRRGVAAGLAVLVGQVHVSDLVPVLLLRVAAEQELDAGEQTVLVEPDLCTLGIEADELQSGIVLAALVPGCNEPVPEAVDGRPVVVEGQLTIERGEKVM